MNEHEIQAALETILTNLEGKAAIADGYSYRDVPLREGLQETPARVARAYREWFAGYKMDPGALFKTFDDGAENYDQMIVLDSIPVQSHCEHHMAPFVGTAVVGYIPNKRIIGLSKIPKLVNVFAKRLQVQERLTTQVADAMMEYLKPMGAGVVIRAEHFCMATRGVHVPGVFTTTSALRGNFMIAEVRSEFLSLAHKGT